MAETSRSFLDPAVLSRLMALPLNARQAMLGQFTGPDKVKGAFEQNGTWFVLIASEHIPAGPKELSECRGQVIADYQKHLESEWMKELATQFPLEMLGAL